MLVDHLLETKKDYNLKIQVIDDIFIKSSDKILDYKAFNIARILKYDGYQRGLASMVYIFFDKNSTLLGAKSVAGGAVKNEVLYKPIIRKFEITKSILIFCR